VSLLPYNQRRVAPLQGAVTRVSAERLLEKRTNQLRDENSRAGFRNPQDTTRSRPFRQGLRRCSSAFGRCTVALYALKLLLDGVNNAFRDH
jgi:HlyD family secretion protein